MHMNPGPTQAVKSFENSIFSQKTEWILYNKRVNSLQN